jgi:hypothetical protein
MIPFLGSFFLSLDLLFYFSGFGIPYPKLQNLAKALPSFCHLPFSPPAKAGGNSILDIRQLLIGIRLLPIPNQTPH